MLTQKTRSAATEQRACVRRALHSAPAFALLHLALICLLWLQVMARRQPEARRSVMEFNVPPECCSSEATIWQRVSEFLNAGWTGFVLESDRQGEPSSMRVRATKVARQDAPASVTQGGGGETIRDCHPSAAVERPTKRPRISSEQDMESGEPVASAVVSESETALEGPVDSAANAQQLVEPTLSLCICVDKRAGVTGSAGAGATVASTIDDSPSDDRSLSVRVEFLTGSASSRSEFWKLAETLKADVLRNNRRWRRQAKLAATTATPVAGSEPKAASIEGKG